LIDGSFDIWQQGSDHIITHSEYRLVRGEGVRRNIARWDWM
jgi:hypothetical protein